MMPALRALDSIEFRITSPVRTCVRSGANGHVSELIKKFVHHVHPAGAFEFLCRF